MQTPNAHASAVVILLEVNETPGITHPIQITPDHAWISFEDQQVIWVSDGRDDVITIEFLSPEPPTPPPPGSRGKLKHQPGWSAGQHTGNHPYKVTVIRNGTPFVQNPPELIIDF